MAGELMIDFASSSSLVSPKKYDVFLSFRGEDTRKGFISHLHDALIQKKVETYIDYRLQKGDKISEALIKAIEESHVSIVIFSQNYATSKWCLDEINEIIECKKKLGQDVIPVFYEVDPSHVRNQRGSYEEAFATHQRDLKISHDRVQNWRGALKESANLAGWDSRTYGTESGFIKDIVNDVLQKLNVIYPIEFKGMVGIEENYAGVESLLDIGSQEVRMIGIWGMGGIGKTALASALHAKLSSQFEGRCFLPSVREKLEKYGLDVLRNKLYSDLLEEENLHVDVPKVVPHFVTSRLRCKRVFIVLDDVADSEQLEDLISDYDSLGPGSRVIVTTRDKHIFSHVDGIYEVKELNDHHSLQLFCWNAFREKHPKDGYEELSKNVIAYCKGNPLGLKVLGAHFRSKSIEIWKCELRKLQKIPNVKIHNVLKLSFDDLDCTEKDIFLDIACFLKGEYRDHVTSLLEACDFFAAAGVEVLLDKSLITISDKCTIEMHDLIQEMGWKIVRQESIKNPGKRSRLWDPEEVSDVLKYDRGTEAIEGIMLDVSKIGDLHLSFDCFAKMTNIRFLKFHDGKESGSCKIYLPNGLESLPDKLRYLQWHGYSQESLPSTFNAKLLVELSMSSSNLEKLWDGVQNLVNLKGIDLSLSEHLVEIPDLSMATNLEGLSLAQCRSLRHVHPSISSLHKLRHLDLAECTEIESLQSDNHLKSLRFLRLSNCSSLREFSMSSEELELLWLDGTIIQELPSSVLCCAKLRLINLQDCDNLQSFGNDPLCLGSLDRLVLAGCKLLNASNLSFILDGLRSLRLLDLENCCNLEALPDNIGLLSSLHCLKLSGSNVESLSANIKNLLMLEELTLNNCRKLVSLPELPPSFRVLSAINCTSLVTDFTQLYMSFLVKPRHKKSVFHPGALVPDWFSFRAEEASITIPYLPLSGLCGFVFSLIVTRSPPNCKYKSVGCLIYKYDKLIRREDTFLDDLELIPDHVSLWYIDIKKDEVCDPHNMSFNFFLQHEDGKWSMKGIKGCGVYPIYASEQKGLELELEFGGRSKDIVELEPNNSKDIDELQPRAIGFRVEESNYNNEDDQASELLEVMHKTITTGMQNENVGLNENSSCHSFIVSTAQSCMRKQQSFKEVDCCVSSIPKNQIIPFDTPSASNINSNQTIEVSKEKDLTNNQVKKYSKSFMFEKVYNTLAEIDNPHLEPNWDPIAELESLLYDSYKLVPMSIHSTIVSKTDVQDPNVAAILEKLETLLETSLEIISSDDKVKQQLHHVLEQFGQFEDRLPIKLRQVIHKLKAFIEGVDVRFATDQITIQNYDQLLQSRSLLSKQLGSAKALQDQFKSKVSQGKIQIEKINSEIVDLEQKLSVLVETRDRLKRALGYCDFENSQLKTQVAQWVPECKTIISTLKKYETSYKVALTNKKKAEDEWADLKKAFLANKI